MKKFLSLVVLSLLFGMAAHAQTAQSEETFPLDDLLLEDASNGETFSLEDLEFSLEESSQAPTDGQNFDLSTEQALFEADSFGHGEEELEVSQFDSREYIYDEKNDRYRFSPNPFATFGPDANVSTIVINDGNRDKIERELRELHLQATNTQAYPLENRELYAPNRNIESGELTDATDVSHEVLGDGTYVYTEQPRLPQTGAGLWALLAAVVTVVGGSVLVSRRLKA